MRPAIKFLKLLGFHTCDALAIKLWKQFQPLSPKYRKMTLGAPSTIGRRANADSQNARDAWLDRNGAFQFSDPALI